MGTSCPVRRFVRTAGALALAAGGLLAGESPVRAGDPVAATSRALARFLESAQVGPAAEFRFLVVHTVLVPPAGDAPAGAPAIAASVAQDALGLPSEAHDGRSEAKVASLGPRAAWLLPGDVLRLRDADFAVRSDAAAPAGGTADVPVVRVSKPSPAGSPREEPRRIGSLPGPGLLWTVLSADHAASVLTACSDLADEVKLDDARGSPADLARAKSIAARVAEYRRQLGAPQRSPGAAGRQVAGYVAILDGGFAAFEVFSDPARFAAVWPERIEGLAVEASVLELENDALDAVLPASDDPDRFVRTAKDAILPIYGLDPRPERVEGLGTVLRLEKADDVGRAVLDVAGAPQHVVWLRDPARRHAGPSDEEDSLDPGVLSRKFRPTVFERRWLERRRTRPRPRGQ